MNTVEEIETEISEVKALLAPLQLRASKLNQELAKQKSLNFIQACEIKLGDVEMSDAQGSPWFGTVWEFGKWIAKNSSKRWAEWNGIIYHSSDLAEGRMPDGSGRVSDLKE